jgi:predicted HTH transcriptional regulator
MKSRVERLIEQGEGVSLDFKQCITSAAKIAKTMVSFANTEGGTLLIGVKDNGRISGISSEDELHMLHMAADFYSRPVVPFETEIQEVQGKTVLLAHIPKGPDRPYAAKGEDEKFWVYVRVHDNSILASKTTVDFMREQRSGRSVKLKMGGLEEQILKFTAERGKITLNLVCKRFNIGRRRASRMLVDLMRLDLLRSHTFEKEEYFTLVGH